MELPANVEQQYEAHQAYSVARFKGEVTLWQAVELVESAMTRAMGENTARLLVSAAELTGFPSPNVADRYFIARRWAQHAKGRLKLALVIRYHMIDPERFGVVVARNEGLLAEVSDREDEALAWLLEGS